MRTNRRPHLLHVRHSAQRCQGQNNISSALLLTARQKPDLTVAVLLERLGRITKKLQRIEGYAGKEKGKERDNRRTINLKDKDQISRDGTRTETVCCCLFAA